MGDIFKLREILEQVSQWKSPRSPIIFHSNILLSFTLSWFITYLYCYLPCTSKISTLSGPIGRRHDNLMFLGPSLLRGEGCSLLPFWHQGNSPRFTLQINATEVAWYLNDSKHFRWKLSLIITIMADSLLLQKSKQKAFIHMLHLAWFLLLFQFLGSDSGND